MGDLLENGLQRARNFYIEKLVKTGNYHPQELFSMTISDLKMIYQKEPLSKKRKKF